MRSKAFTLLEMLVVIGIIAFLAAFVFVTLDPLTLFAESRNTRRWSDVNNLTTAIYRYTIDKSAYPTDLNNFEQQIGTASSGCNILCANATVSCINLADELKDYLLEIPVDPLNGNAQTTGYSVVKNDDIITVKACNAENDVNIRISR